MVAHHSSRGVRRVAVRGPITAALTTMSNVSLTDALLLSVAVTFTESVPALVGVPEKVRVAGVKVSQVVDSSAPAAVVAV